MFVKKEEIEKKKPEPIKPAVVEPVEKVETVEAFEELWIYYVKILTQDI